MDSPIPLVAVIMMTVAAAWFTQRVMQNQWVKKVAKGGWVPLVCHSMVSPWTRAEEVIAKIGAMLISSGTGMVLDRGVGKYRGFALLAISMTGKSTPLTRALIEADEEVRSDRVYRRNPRQSPFHDSPHKPPSPNLLIPDTSRSFSIAASGYTLPNRLPVSGMLHRFRELGEVDRYQSRVGRMVDFRSDCMSHFLTQVLV